MEYLSRVANKAYFDFKVFNPFAIVTQVNHSKQLIQRLKMNRNVFTCFGEMSKECNNFYKLAEKRNIEPSESRTWLRTRLSFCLVRSANLCIRGSRSRKQKETEPLADTSIDLAMTISGLSAK